MAFIPVPDTIQVEVRGELQGVNVENTFYYLSPGTIDQALLDAVADAALAYVEGDMSLFNNNFTLREVYARDLSDSTFLSALAPSLTSPTGAYTDPNPNQVTFALKRTSGFSGRSARGRIFWMGIAEGHTSGTNIMDVGAANDMVDWLKNLDIAVALEGVTPVIVSRYNAGVPRTTGVTYPLADWSWSDLRVDTQKGRLP